MSLIDDARASLTEAAALIHLPTETLARLSQPQRRIEVSVPLTRDNGTTETYRGYRVQWNNLRGPYKGGLRYHPHVDEGEVEGLACLMMIKCAALGIPFGGGKGGIQVDPKSLSLAELERLTRAFVHALGDAIGPTKDVPAPDVGTTAQMMDWFADEYGKIVGHPEPAVVTGKTIGAGGSEGRSVATGTGVFMAFEALRPSLALDTESTTVVVQGFGNVGQEAAHQFYHHGYTVVAVSDSRGGIHDERGLDIPAVVAHKGVTGSVVDFPGARNVTDEELLTLPCGILVPAALEEQVTKENAERIQAKIILEAANGPTTPEADAILAKNGIVVIPDVLANAGGVVVSYFEWMQNREGVRWTREEVLHRLAASMKTAAQDVYQFSKTHGCTLRLATIALALERLGNA
jgi:glutamate dehydrogenase/leucine dehydrogenase